MYDNWQGINKEFIINLRESLRLTQKEFGKMFGISQAQVGHIEQGRRPVSSKMKIAIVEKYPEYVEGIPKKESFIFPVPFFNIGASCGNGNILPDSEPEKDVLYFDTRFLKNVLGVKPEFVHLIYADGDSMDSGFNAPDDIKDGDLLMIDTNRTEGNNKTYAVIINNQELRVKKLQRKGNTLILHSNNPKYQDVVYDDSQIAEVKVIGRVVWNGSRETL